MTITLTKATLLPALTLANRVVERRTTIPILSNVLLSAQGGRLTIAATDLDIEMRTTVPCAGADAATTLPAAPLTDIIRKLPDGADIDLADEGGQWLIRSGRSRFRLQALPASDFVELSQGAAGLSFALPAKALSGIIAGLRFAISSEETRFYLNGIHFHQDADEDGAAALVAVATDGHRMAKRSLPLPAGAEGLAGIILPRRTVELLTHFLPSEGDVDLTWSETRIVISRADGAELTTKLIDGTFPDYRRVVPQGNANRFSVDRSAFASAINRVLTVASGRGSALKLDFGESELTISGKNPDAGTAEETLSIEMLDGAPVEIGFNGRYCLDMTGASAAEAIVFELGDAGTPALIRPAGDEAGLFVLMPMRI